VSHPRLADRTLLLLALLYAMASLIHFAHNAIFLPDYPNLPAWLTPGGVWAAWCGVTAVGAFGFHVHARISRVPGLVILAVYGLLGFAGLDHYTVAPVSAHSLMMNSTILFEVATAAAFLAFVGHSLRAVRHSIM
jgi:hypothetical protein